MVLQKLNRTTVVFAMLALQIPQAGYSKESLLSPPLPRLQHKRLLITVPQTGRITKRDEKRQWETSSYNFQIDVQQKKERRYKHSQKFSIYFEMLQWPRSRAERHDMLQGKKEVSQCGISSIRTIKLYKNTVPPDTPDQNEYFTIPLPNDEVIVLRAAYSYSHRHLCSPFVHSIFQQMRFIHKLSKTYPMKAKNTVSKS